MLWKEEVPDETGAIGGEGECARICIRVYLEYIYVQPYVRTYVYAVHILYVVRYNNTVISYVCM